MLGHCYNAYMGLEDAIPSACPCCHRIDQLVRAVDVRQDASEPSNERVDVALPAYELWSVLLVGAIVLLFLSAIATGGSAGTSVDTPEGLAGVLMAAAFALGIAGFVLTRRTMASMRAVEPRVRHYHEYALYCGNCARIHFQTRELPPGVESRVAWTIPEYRRELWYACGFARARIRR